jgi:hypothetical protein
MSDEVMESYIRQTLEAQRVPEITITWQGGEPTLMGLDFYRRAVEVARAIRGPARPFSTPSKPTESCSTKAGANSSAKIGFWSASAWMARANCTMSTAATKADEAPSIERRSGVQRPLYRSRHE